MLFETLFAAMLALGAGQDWMKWTPQSAPPSTPSTPSSVGSGTATVVVIRNRNMVGMAMKYKIVLDGEERGRIAIGRYMTFEVKPGPHRVDVGCFGGWTPTAKVASVRFDANPDETHYFRVHADANCAGIEELPAHDGERLRADAKETQVGQ